MCPSSSGWCASLRSTGRPAGSSTDAPAWRRRRALGGALCTRERSDSRKERGSYAISASGLHPTFSWLTSRSRAKAPITRTYKDDAWAVHISHTERFNLWEEFEAAYRSLSRQWLSGPCDPRLLCQRRAVLPAADGPATRRPRLTPGCAAGGPGRGGGSRRHRSRLRAGHHVAETARRDRLRRGLCLAERAPGPFRSVGGSLRYPGFAAQREVPSWFRNSEGNCTHRRTGHFTSPSLDSRPLQAARPV